MTGLIVILVAAIIFGAIARNMARKRGRTEWWTLAGVFLGLLGLLIIGLAGYTNEANDARMGRTRPV